MVRFGFVGQKWYVVVFVISHDSLSSVVALVATSDTTLTITPEHTVRNKAARHGSAEDTRVSHSDVYTMVASTKLIRRHVGTQQVLKITCASCETCPFFCCCGIRG